MGLFKSKDERRIESEMKIRARVKSIERGIREQEKFADDFIKNAQQAKKIGDQNQYLFIRNALKKTAIVKKTMERQVLILRNFMLMKQQAQAGQQFAESMAMIAGEIGKIFGQMDLAKTQTQWEQAMAQAGTMEERMDVLLESMEQSATGASTGSAREELVTDQEIDRLINADVLAAEKSELGKLDELESEITKELGGKQKD